MKRSISVVNQCNCWLLGYQIHEHVCLKSSSKLLKVDPNKTWKLKMLFMKDATEKNP